ncbi:MAG: hypothetical protein U5M51_16470 [Emticicia sp.]|nr:hypothetical protein [Emticicia sp.]
MKKSIIFLGFAFFATTLFSCEKEETITPLVIPTAYDATSFTANATAEYELRTNFTALINEVKKGRVGGTVLSATKLTELFNAGSNSVSKYASATVKSTMPTLFAELEKASKGKTYQFGKTPAENIDGGANGGYLFDETGLELEQIVEKGSFNSIFYNKAVELVATPTAANLDKVLALYGANPTFPNTPTASKTAQPDTWMANYGARRTKAAGGLYTQQRDAFIKAQAAIKAGDKYNTDRDAAIAEILLKWEQINAATVINYLYDTETKLASTNPTDAVKASAMHAYGEATGFLTGFKGITKKKITDAQIDNALVKMNSTAPYKIVGSPTEIAKLVQVRKDLQAVYGFTDTQMEEFKNNYINVEAR